MQTEPSSGVAMPLEVEVVAADSVETGEGRVKPFAEILRETGAVALNEAILGAVPLAEDIDGISLWEHKVVLEAVQARLRTKP